MVQHKVDPIWWQVETLYEFLQRNHESINHVKNVLQEELRHLLLDGLLQKLSIHRKFSSIYRNI